MILHAGRQSGMAACPLAVSEILTVARLFGFEGTSCLEFLDIIQGVDRGLLALHEAENEQKSRSGNRS